uniref:Uncharacterized protein n=1 Tax=Odontella aurita TaxID=265563 RepID=A0A7S4MDS3_9STRA|mmetsp:Transcript_18618/g.53690  ORF Transcript_18618/g.53690 Transcript_18618/m.53690 type:complete len:180 (+) Transcript_18618:117-656(+)
MTTRTDLTLRAGHFFNVVLVACILLRRSAADAAFAPHFLLSRRDSCRSTVEYTFGRPRALSSSIGMAGSLHRINKGNGSGGDDEGVREVGTEGVHLEGCVVEESGGRYYCTADEDGGASIGDNDLTEGVRYLLNEGMTIRTRAGNEFEMKIEGCSQQGDPAMAMMFNAMRAGFATADED